MKKNIKNNKDFEKQEQNKIIKIKSLLIQILLTGALQITVNHSQSAKRHGERDGERKKLNIIYNK